MSTEERLVVVGSGAIATGLAATAATQGEVALLARSPESEERAAKALDKVAPKLGEGVRERVRIFQHLHEAVEGATFVVEAIHEDMALKAALLRELHVRSGDDVVLGSTTSSLSVAELSAASGRPDRFVGFHVFNPVPRMELIELCFPEQASGQTRERSRALCEKLGKTAVEVPDLPGFVVNRLLFPFLFSAVELHERTGIAPAALDKCMQLGAGHPMGPLALLDFVGLDVSIAIGNEIGAQVPAKLHELAEAGKLGRKAGRGFYDYN